jgi:hypothetical protein
VQVVNASIEVDWLSMRLLLRLGIVEKLLRLSGCGKRIIVRYDMTPRGRVDFNDVSLIPDAEYRIPHHFRPVYGKHHIGNKLGDETILKTS